MKQLISSVLSGIIVSLGFWVPIVLVGTFFLKRNTGHYPLDLFGTGIDPKIPIFVGILLAATHGSLVGFVIGAFKIRSVLTGAAAAAAGAVVLVAISHIYDRLTASEPFYGRSSTKLENFIGAFGWFLIVAFFIAIPSVVIGSLCVPLSRYFDGLFSVNRQ